MADLWDSKPLDISNGERCPNLFIPNFTNSPTVIHFKHDTRYLSEKVLLQQVPKLQGTLQGVSLITLL